MLMANIVGVENVVNKESFIKLFCHFSFFFLDANVTFIITSAWKILRLK